MVDVPSDLLQVGGTFSGLGVVFYILLKLLERYSGSEKFYKGRIDELTVELVTMRKERDEWKEEAIKCAARADTLKNQFTSVRRKGGQ